MIARLNEHLKSPLSAIGIALWLAIAFYIFSSIILLAVGYQWLGAFMFASIIGAASYLAFQESIGFRSRFPRFANIAGLIHALVVVGVLIYVGLQFLNWQ